MIPKLQTKEEKEKREKRSRLIMTIVVVVILGVSTAAYALMETQTTETKKYKEFTFFRTDEGWKPKKMNFVTSYLPQDVENISISGSLKLDDFTENAYIVAISNYEITAANELLKVLRIKKANIACLPENENETFCADFPIKDCRDAAIDNGIIIFSESNETSVSYDNYCLQIRGSKENFIKAVDRIIFELYGIIS
ncbi:MAG: hypothetical protein QW041_00490 [Candidatus Pacearchaeota archaeon]